MSARIMQPTQTLQEDMAANTKISVTRIMLMTDFSKASLNSMAP